MTQLFLFIVLVALLAVPGECSVELLVTNNGPAVRGSSVTVTATYSGWTGEELKYVFWDDAQPSHRHEEIVTSNTTSWTIVFSRDLYESGEYTVKVNLLKKQFFWFTVARNETTLKITDTLNGALVLSQNSTDRPNTFVAVNQTVNHRVRLPAGELAFLEANASSVITYWFIDCQYIDQTASMALNYTYRDLMKDHLIDVLVVANNEPLPPVTTPRPVNTTTPQPPSNTTLQQGGSTTPQAGGSSTPQAGGSSTPQAGGSTTPPPHKVSRRAAPTRRVGLSDFICHNTGIVPIGDKYTYGHYQQTISVREPILSVNITGRNWLQHEDLMHLQVKYSGSPPFHYCAVYKLGVYNITGNETCDLIQTVSNDFPLVHYFSDSEQHTVVVVIENDIGKTVTRAAINIYKVAVNSQLSVIVVPVIFCLLAVILIVFGVAYYQHRSRHTIEVADFDFGQQAHFDYKTFKERLRDSLRGACPCGKSPDDTEPLTPAGGYNIM